MTQSDIPAGMRLKEISGWNQTSADWERFLEASPQGCFVAEVDRSVRGTATTITYEDRFAWIGMVLVDPEFRGHGIGTRLLDKTIEHLDASSVPIMKLDATPQGKHIYEKLGFTPEYEIERWMLRRKPVTSSPRQNSPRPELASVLTLDHEVFGANRSNLLRSLDREAPEFTLATFEGNGLAGYTFGRRGSRADHLGPWMARNETAAATLLDQFLKRSDRETVIVDCLKDSPFASTLLSARKFEFSRSFTRMFRGRNNHPGRPELLSAVMGPEFG